MDKILLVFKREYLTRVFKRSFVLTTLLTPLALFAFILVLGLIMTYDSDDMRTVLVSDPTDILGGEIMKNKSITYEFSDKDLETLKSEYQKGEDYIGILHLPEIQDLAVKDHRIYYFSDEQLSFDVSTAISDRVRSKIRDYKIVQLGIDPSQLEKINTKIILDPEPISEDVEDSTEDSTLMRAILGGAMGYIMFFIILIYGMMVMRSVMEEKINRIVEIMISSVKPFQLMLGKILGVGAVGLTQILIWTLLVAIFSTVAMFIVGPSATADMTALAENSTNLPPEIKEGVFSEFADGLAEFRRANWILIIPLFLIYFIGGYIIYTSLFAAVGSAIGDDLNEGNSLTMPLMLPIVIAVYIMFKAVESPNSSLSVWSSMVPFLSPIVMPARLAADIPFWQIAISVLLLALFCLFSVWIAARIYRVGILLYGKKASFKELGKWIFSK